MNEKSSQNAVNALLAEYSKVINELQQVIWDLSDPDLAFIVDSNTQNPDCKSIQTVLTHVVNSGYSYCVYIRNHRNIPGNRPEKANRATASEYIKDLDAVVKYTNDTFADIYDSELEEYDNAKKMMTSWKQAYDIEQLMEHAIVHIMRHRRQIEKFKVLCSKNL